MDIFWQRVKANMLRLHCNNIPIWPKSYKSYHILPDWVLFPCPGDIPGPGAPQAAEATGLGGGGAPQPEAEALPAPPEGGGPHPEVPLATEVSPPAPPLRPMRGTPQPERDEYINWLETPQDLVKERLFLAGCFSPRRPGFEPFWGGQAMVILWASGLKLGSSSLNSLSSL